MKNFFTHIDHNLLPIINKASHVANKNSVHLYVVGGIVRDILLKKHNIDLDFVVEGDAIKFAKSCAKVLHADCLVYKEFQTATCILPDKHRVDFATARKEYYPRPGSLPVVRPGQLIDDLLRRDFTVNTLAISVSQSNFGNLIDECGGQKDLKAKKIRILHKKSFKDDPTRILRAIRFEQRFQFKLEATTLKLLKEAVRRKYTKYVKPPRLFEEFKKMLSEPNPVRPLKRLNQLNGLSIIDSKLTFDSARLNRFHQACGQYVKKDPSLNIYQWLFYFNPLIEKCKNSQIDSIIKKFKFTREEGKIIKQCHKAPSVIRRLSKKRLKRSQVYEILHPLLLWTAIYIRLRSSNPTAVNNVQRYIKQDRLKRLFINGNDVKRLGVRSGKSIGEYLNHLLCLKLDGKVKTKQSEIKMLQSLI